jgi:alanine racemase
MNHRSWVEISRSAFSLTVHKLTKIMNSQQISLNVKANAYGHGLREMGLLAEQEPAIAWLCTDRLNDAIMLRRWGIKKPILILLDISDSLPDSLPDLLHFAVRTQEQITLLQTYAQKIGAPIAVHIKIDTDGSQVGFSPQDCHNLVTTFKSLWIKIGSPLLSTQLSHEMCALGQKSSFLSWKTRIYHIKELPASTSVGYNQSYRTTTPTRVAVLPIGYADGYPRALSNKGHVYVKGLACPVIGLVSMNLMTINITHVPNVAVGDEVTLLGSNILIMAESLADQAGMISAELITGISPLLPRIITN